MPHVSNVIATVNDVKVISELVHRHGVKLLVDGAQAVPHMPVNMTEYGVDFYAFSGVKVTGSEGTGALYVAPELHDQLHPFDGGGDMMHGLTQDAINYKPFPHNLEPGTRIYSSAIALGRAIETLQTIGMENIHREIHALGLYAYRRLQVVKGISFLPPNPEDGTSDGSLIPFTFYHEFPNVTNAAVARALGKRGIMLREGCLCAQLTTMHFGWDGQEGVIRPSFYPLYNDYDEIDRMVEALQEIVPDLAATLPMPAPRPS
jgi:cysteine desulfurase/selenocysteine lyase